MQIVSTKMYVSERQIYGMTLETCPLFFCRSHPVNGQIALFYGGSVRQWLN